MDQLTELAVAAARGDHGALDALVRLTQTDVWRFCAAFGGIDAADDLTQDTFARAIQSLHRFRAESSARTWLLTIARNACADHVRRNVRRRRLTDRLRSVSTADAYVVADHGGGTDLDALVAALEPERRLAFVLTQTLGLSYAEAAEVCSCPVGTIRSRVSRSREELVLAVAANEHPDAIAGSPATGSD